MSQRFLQETVNALQEKVDELTRRVATIEKRNEAVGTASAGNDHDAPVAVIPVEPAKPAAKPKPKRKPKPKTTPKPEPAK